MVSGTALCAFAITVRMTFFAAAPAPADDSAASIAAKV
jgi:hypothetical protein